MNIYNGQVQTFVIPVVTIKPSSTVNESYERSDLTLLYRVDAEVNGSKIDLALPVFESREEAQEFAAVLEDFLGEDTERFP